MTRRVRTYSRFRDGFAIAIVVAVAVGVGWLYLRDEARQQPEAGPSRTATPSYDTARHQMEALPVRGWDRVSDFNRIRFGEPWSDDVNVEFGHNGCNTRATIDFVRGPDTSSAVQIDHVVALADAWYKGARLWDDQRRRDFANDPRNLLAVAGQVNFDKAFRDAASWLPPNTGFRCAFVARQVEVKTDYRLWGSGNEKDALRRALRDC